MRCAALPPAQLPGSNCRRPEPLRICPKAPRAGNRKADACEGGGIRPRGRTIVQNETVPVAISALSSAWLGIVGGLVTPAVVWPDLPKAGRMAGLCASVQKRPVRRLESRRLRGRKHSPRSPRQTNRSRRMEGPVAMRPPLGMVRYRGGLAVPAAVGPDRHMAGACTSVVRKRPVWQPKSRRLRERNHSSRPRGQPSLRKRECCPWRYRPSALGRARHRRGRHSAAWPVTGLGTPEDFMRKPRSSWSKGATGYSPEKQASQYCGQALLRPLASPTAR
ncbi:hypothetical protein SAMN04244548_04827 [Paracoccus pantotrophus]|nr:hypothetical protein SAMN04244548_04827 [Paracoccus pantotrophus]